MMNPYEALGSSAYWRTAVAEPGAEGLTGLWQPKFKIEATDKIATAGSCFAQHIGKALAGRGYGWTDYEPAPPLLLNEDARQFNYGIFSFRTGNIYTPKVLNQWLDLAFRAPHRVDELWEQDGRWYDPLRPVIEPGGFASREELLDARANTYAAIRNAVQQSQVFVFTLGLTESWRNRDTGHEYAICPGTAAGMFDPEKHKFNNAGFDETHRSLRKAIRFMRRINGNLRFLLTVSPVPLTATASGQHVLPATQYSKSVLRAVAGQAAQELDFVDYFPSFEIITHPVFQGRFFAENQRSVLPEGVETVMQHFFSDQARAFGLASAKAKTARKPKVSPLFEEDVKCEEALLDAFVA